MSTIYRYLDVLSVEKCIDNINDFIKKTHIYHNVRYIIFFYFPLHCQNKKTYNMKKKYRLVTTANNVEVVTSYDRLMYAQDYEDVF